MKFSSDLPARFWAKAKKTTADDCWIWLGRKLPKGYGQIATGLVGGGSLYSHRVAYFLEHGKFDLSLDVLHRCDNPSCVNPDHLFLGTQLENMRDMIKKGRNRGGARTGERHKMALLTNKQVFQIRRIYNEIGLSRKTLSVLFMVSPAVIGGVVTRRNWKHI